MKDIKLPLWSAQDQEDGKKDANNEKTLEENIAEGKIKSETLAYFMAKSW